MHGDFNSLLVCVYNIYVYIYRYLETDLSAATYYNQRVDRLVSDSRDRTDNQMCLYTSVYTPAVEYTRSRGCVYV